MSAGSQMWEINDLMKKFPRYPRSKLIRAAVLRDGVKFTPNLVDLASWALPQSNWVLEYTHYKHAKEKVEKYITEQALDQESADLARHGWVQTPSGFRFQDYTYIQIGFNDDSPWELRTEWLGSTFSVAGMGGERYFLYYGDERVEEVVFEKRPKWLTEKTSDGKTFSSVMQLISAQVFNACVLRHCEYFNNSTHCRFCSMTGGSQALKKVGIQHQMALKPEHAVEAFEAGQKETGVNVILLSGGSLFDQDKEAEAYCRLTKVLADAREDLRAETYLLAGTTAFEGDKARQLRDLGLDLLMYDLEVWDPEVFAFVCPGKSAHIGRDRWLQRLLDAQAVFGKGRVGTNLVLGAELAQPGGFKNESQALASWNECFEWCLSNGIVPMLTIWQPSAGSQFEGARNTASIEYLLEVGALRRAAMKRYDMFSHCIDMWK
ncbi:MAG: radical SAM protein [Candidatus Binatia bacterium]